jgi:hypothetical protein
MTTNFLNTSTVFPTGQTVNKTLISGTNGQILQVDSTNPTGFSFTTANAAHVAADNLITMPAVSYPGAVTMTNVGVPVGSFRLYFTVSGSGAPGAAFYNAIVVGGVLTATPNSGAFGGPAIVTSKQIANVLFGPFYYIDGTMTGYTNGDVLNPTQAEYDTIRSPLSSALNVGSQSIISSTGNVTINPQSDIIDVTGSRITNVAAPTGQNDATNLAYVQSTVVPPANNLVQSSPVTLIGQTYLQTSPSAWSLTFTDNGSNNGLNFYNAAKIGSRITATFAASLTPIASWGDDTYGVVTFKTTAFGGTLIVQGLNGPGTAITGYFTNPTVLPYADIRAPLLAPIDMGSQSLISSTGSVIIDPANNLIDVTSSRIVNVAEPTGATDAATLQTVNSLAFPGADNLISFPPAVDAGPRTLTIPSAGNWTMTVPLTFYNAIVVGGSMTATPGTGTFGTTNLVTTKVDSGGGTYTISGTYTGPAVQGTVTNVRQQQYTTIRTPLVRALDLGNQSIISSIDDVTINPASNLINVTNSRIINCLDPTIAQDVSTKAYTDAGDAATLAAAITTIGNGIRSYNNANVRNAAIPTPTEGIWTFLRVPSVLQFYDGLTYQNFSQQQGLPGNIFISASPAGGITWNQYNYDSNGSPVGANVPRGTTVLAIFAATAGASFTMGYSGPNVPNIDYRTIPVEYLIVAGGGGGGGTNAEFQAGGAGGGAGGVLQGMGTIQLSVSGLTVTYPVQVGLGGTGGTNQTNITARGQNGGNTILTLGTNTVTGNGNVTLTAIGGGGGATRTLFQTTGTSGGSGGGGADGGFAGSGTPGQGNAGAQNVSFNGSGGGGGAGTPAGGGGSASNGGNGILNRIAQGYLTTEFGGGGGARFGLPGSGGGGYGGLGVGSPAQSGTNGTGGGGGGAEFTSGGAGGNGGTGIILLRFASRSVPVIAGS